MFAKNGPLQEMCDCGYERCSLHGFLPRSSLLFRDKRDTEVDGLPIQESCRVLKYPPP
jgi:hypothetical protein